MNVEVNQAKFQQVNIAVDADNGELRDAAWQQINAARNESNLVCSQAAAALARAADESQCLRGEADRLVMAAQAEAGESLRSARVHLQVAEQERIGNIVATQQARESDFARQQATALASAQSQQLRDVQTARANQSSRQHEVIRDLQFQIDQLNAQTTSPTQTSMRSPISFSPSPIRSGMLEAREPQCTTDTPTRKVQMTGEASAGIPIVVACSGSRRMGTGSVATAKQGRKSRSVPALQGVRAVRVRDTSVPARRTRMASPPRGRRRMPKEAVLGSSMTIDGVLHPQGGSVTDLPSWVKYCTACGTARNPGAIFCGSCGRHISRGPGDAVGSSGSAVRFSAKAFPASGSRQRHGSVSPSRAFDAQTPDTDSSDSDDDTCNGGEDYVYEHSTTGINVGDDHPMMDLWGPISPTPRVDNFETYVMDEASVYKTRQLPAAGCLPRLPQNAAEFRRWCATLLAIFAAFDLSSNDTLSKWLAHALNVVGDARVALTKFHDNSQGLNRLDRWLASEMMRSRNLMSSMFGTNFATYAEWCQRHGSSPRGRTLIAMVCIRFRLDRNRGKLLNTMHLFRIQLASYKNDDIKNFMANVRFVLAGLNVSELQDHNLLFEWLFNKFRNWKAIEDKIEIIKSAREGSSRRTWNYLWAAINTHIANRDEDDNCAQLEQALSTKTVGAAAATKTNGKAKGKGKGKGKSKARLPQGTTTIELDEEKEEALPGAGALAQLQFGHLAESQKQKTLRALATMHRDRTPQQKKMLLCNKFRDGKCQHADPKDCEYSHNKTLLDAAVAKKKVDGAAAAKFGKAVEKAAADTLARGIARTKAQIAKAKSPPTAKATSAPSKAVGASVAPIMARDKPPLVQAFMNIVAKR